ncbi:outer membrane protein assembly factor BamA [Alteromonadaceae bacterium M269]|nr:outer membrane protein assembly factor BamA [Alteromonadaceae bacterium M269]
MKLRQFVLAGWLLSLISFMSTAQQNEFVVEDIRVEGLQRVALGAALTFIPVQVGDRMNQFRISQLIRSLYSSSHFEDIQVIRDGQTLLIRVRERPTISNIVFEGNDDIEDEQLQESLDDSNIRIGEPLNKTVLTSIENGLKDFFHSIGKYEAQVDAIVTPLPRNRVDLKLVFEEGDSADIQQINIVGNEVFGDEELLDLFELKFDTPWWNFTAEKRYQKQKLGGDIETLTSYYKDRGYLQFQVDSTQVSLTPEQDSIYITLNLTEGETYTVSDVELAGDLLGHEFTVEQIIPLKAGSLYSLAQVTFTEEFISKYLARFGYAFPTVTTIPEVNEDDKTVKLTLSVDPGKRIYVRRINFKGNAVTADEVLRRNSVQMEGAWLSNTALETTKARLSRQTYLEEVDFETIRLADEDDKVDIDFNVKEQASGSFNAGVGFGDRTGLSLQAGIQQDNFLGTGNRLAFNINTIRFQQSVSVSYTDPFFTVDGISLGGSIGFSKFDGGSANLIQFNQETISLGVNIGYPVDEFNRVGFGLNYLSRSLNQTQAIVQTERFFNLLVDEFNPDQGIDYDTFLARINWSRVTLNRGVFPTDGSEQRASFNISTPNSDVNYFTLQYESRFYFPLSRNHKWAFLTRFEAGYGNGYGSINGNDQILPFTDNFRLGGSDSLRGFEVNVVGPRAIRRQRRTALGPDGRPIVLGRESDTISIDRRTLGGNAMALASMEFIVPTPFLPEGLTNSVRTSFFVDAGNVWDTEFDLDDFEGLEIVNSALPELADFGDPGRFRASAGLSIQWLAPLGPLSFSFSRALKEQDGDEVDFFSFNIGQTF